MGRLALDHITIQCRDLESSRRFYVDVLNLKDGYRPPFDGPPGAWLYDDEGRPIVHLFAGSAEEEGARSTSIDHVAFVVDDLPAVKARLEDRGIPFDGAIVPDLGVEQIFLCDPDGIQIELGSASAAELIRVSKTP